MIVNKRLIGCCIVILHSRQFEDGADAELAGRVLSVWLRAPEQRLRQCGPGAPCNRCPAPSSSNPLTPSIERPAPTKPWRAPGPATCGRRCWLASRQLLLHCSSSCIPAVDCTRCASVAIPSSTVECHRRCSIMHSCRPPARYQPAGSVRSIFSC